MAFNEDEAYMKLAEKEAMVALGEREVPVGCVVVRNGEVIARGHNRTNFELDPTRHAELVAIDALLAEQHEVVNPHPTLCSLAIDISLITRERAIQLGVHSARSAPVRAPLQWCLSGPQQQGSNTRALLDDCTLYVTCEPCIMCATALSMLGLKRTVWGCANDKFGGNGSVMELNAPLPARCGAGWRGYEAVGGLRAAEAVELFKVFYNRANVRAPVPKRRKGDDGAEADAAAGPGAQ